MRSGIRKLKFGGSRRSLGAVAAIALGLVLVPLAAASPAAAADVITCTLRVDNPHASTHVSGTINVSATMTCSRQIAEIYIRTTLYKGTGSPSWQGASNDRFNVAALSANAAAPCSAGPGSFYGYATSTVTPPAGYTVSGPNPVVKRGLSISVACGNARMAAESMPEPDSVTITLVKKN